MKAKKFDCVEMMHRGAEEVQNKVRGMTKEEQIVFWRERSRKLTRRRTTSQAEGKQEAPSPE
jgi:hypothetical protein